MRDEKTKKEMLSQYRELKIVGGVYLIKNAVNNRILLDCNVNIEGAKNRFDFSKKTGSCVNMKLQKDWNQHGADSFSFEILEELQKNENQTTTEFKKDIALLKEMWQQKLKDEDLY